MEVHPASFRDPKGFVFEQDGTLYRQVNESCRESYEALMGSGLYEELTAKGLLVPHVEVDEPRGAPGAYRVLRPEPVPFVSYPCEWCFGQLRHAALATLRIQRIALRHGMSLRDASAFNVQFVGSQPVFIDTLSFERYVDGRPWVAYRQFCEHFLAPLFLRAGGDPRLAALGASWIDGVPLAVARRLAPWRCRWRPGFLAHVSLHARAQERYREASARRRELPRLSRAALERLLESLRATVESISWNPAGTTWAEYDPSASYSVGARDAKKSFVDSVVKETRPARVVDLGANTGEYSAIAARAGASVVAADMDHGAVERCYRRLRAEKQNRILPLVVDLANPTPSFGWMNQERASFLDRCAGKADLVLALALVHHLAIGNNLPLPQVVRLLARCAPRAVVEFVDKPDAQVRRLLASREDIFDDYSPSGFDAALAGVFRVLRREKIEGTERLLYHLERV